MNSLVNVFTFITSLGVVFMNVNVFFLLFVLVINKLEKGKQGNKILSFVSTHAFSLLGIIIILSLGGSYFYSLVAGFIPCKLCWFQRTFFYALVVLYSIGWYKARKVAFVERSIFAGGFILTLFALIVSTFQYYGSMFNPDILAACEAQGVSCSKNYFLSFGYINIPMMALSAFILLFIITLIRLTHTPSSSRVN